MAVSDYSMFDVQAAKEKQRHDTAYEVAQIPRGRMSIYASSVGGDLYNEGLMVLAGMLGGTPDPATAKQQAILEIQERFPEPDTFEEFMELYVYCYVKSQFEKKSAPQKCHSRHPGRLVREHHGCEGF